MRSARVRNGKVQEFEDSRTRPAIKNPGQICIEMHCRAAMITHDIGNPCCSWIWLNEAEGTIQRKEEDAAS